VGNLFTWDLTCNQSRGTLPEQRKSTEEDAGEERTINAHIEWSLDLHLTIVNVNHHGYNSNSKRSGEEKQRSRNGEFYFSVTKLKTVFLFVTDSISTSPRYSSWHRPILSLAGPSPFSHLRNLPCLDPLSSPLGAW
jgi:hypothetical protein